MKESKRQKKAWRKNFRRPPIVIAIFLTIFVGTFSGGFSARAETIEIDELPPSQETEQSSPAEISKTASEPAKEISPEFSDVSTGDSYFIAVNYLREEGIIHGYEDGTFKPDQQVNRAEALKLIADALAEGPGTTNPETMNFPDVKFADWFYASVEQAWNNYLVTGYPDGFFHPEQTINRAESLKMVLIQEGKTLPVTVDTPPYSDVNITDWFAPYAAVSKERTLFLESRESGSLDPSKNMSRGEFAELLYRTLKSNEGSKFGRTTWYGVGVGTASGESFDASKLTTAHKTLPFGTELLVINQSNGKSVTVTVNDRGPYATGMELDLTSGAFESIASLGAGIIVVEFKIINEENADEQNKNEVEYGF